MNLIVGFWVSASRRHRVCLDDDQGWGEGGGGDGEKVQDTAKRETMVERTDAGETKLEARGEGSVR